MSTEQIPAAAQIARVIEESIATLAILRGLIERAGEGLEGWYCTGPNAVDTRLLQLHRLAGPLATVDAKIAARALAPDWEDDGGGDWRAAVPGLPGWHIILHGAVLGVKPSNKIVL